MPLDRPSFIQLLDSYLADMEAEFGGGPYEPRSAEYAEGVAVAGISHQIWGDVALAAEKLIPDRADAESMLRWAALYGITPAAALKHAGSIQYTATGAATIATNDLMRLRDGTVYIATADASVLVAGPIVVQVEASVAGSDGQAVAGAQAILAVPHANIVSEGAVLAPGLSGGANEQSPQVVLARLIQRLRNPPGVGTAADYERWALEVAGVTRAWVIPSHAGAGTVGVVFVRDGDLPGSIIPDAGEVTAVQTYLNTKSPVVATPIAFGPVAYPADLMIALNPNTVALQAAAALAIDAAINTGASYGQLFALSRISEAISAVTGEESHTILSPASDIDPGPTGLVVPGTYTWS